MKQPTLCVQGRETVLLPNYSYTLYLSDGLFAFQTVSLHFPLMSYKKAFPPLQFLPAVFRYCLRKWPLNDPLLGFSIYNHYIGLDLLLSVPFKNHHHNGWHHNGWTGQLLLLAPLCSVQWRAQAANIIPIPYKVLQIRVYLPQLSLFVKPPDTSYGLYDIYLSHLF